MRVVDVYDRYQDITNMAAFAAATDAAYLKGSDGAGPAAVKADAFARVMHETDTPFGLYHYAQFSPSPEVQARVLAAEVKRLGATGLPPALDLEAPFSPNAVARDFAYRFLMELRRQGFDTVTLYANTSMLTGIRAWDLGVPGLRIWAATYGGNDADFDQDDRDRLARQYPHPVWLYQYSSTGRVPGIPQNTDLNMFMTTDGWDDDDMGATEQAQLNQIIAFFNQSNAQPWNQTVFDAIWQVRDMVAGLAEKMTGGQLSKEEVLAQLDKSVQTAMAEKVMPALQASADSILVGEASQELVDQFMRDMAGRLGQPLPPNQEGQTA